MARRIYRNALLLCLACSTVSVQATPPVVVRTEAELTAILASGAPTPLDAFTPYGKRSFLRGLRWGTRGLGGFSYRAMLRELDRAQIEALAAFIDSSAYSPARSRDLSSPPLRLPEPSPEVERRYVQLERFVDEESERRRDAAGASSVVDRSPVERRYLALFGEQMSESVLRKLPAADLPVLFDAATLAGELGSGQAGVAHQQLVYREMQNRGLDTRRGFDETMLNALLSVRDFSQAKVFAANKPHLASWTIPLVHDRLGPDFVGRSVYRYDAATKTLTREAFPYPVGLELVMVVDAGCHFSAKALAALHEDAELRARLLEANLALVTPPRAAISYDFVDQWNKDNPAVPMRILYNASEWKAIKVTGVPQFYLLKNGKVVAELRSGWPAEGNKAALMALLDAARD
ncbi:hypothetical protein [Massilia sp. UBA6681]|uniref:hypothetical protein n=1 Tax=Massilia sp. UBA6681 TaxID=1946839 RepID=UPI0025BE73E8|nr:hypothetical protein [Massilia sp. UBA6681]